MKDDNPYESPRPLDLSERARSVGGSKSGAARSAFLLGARCGGRIGFIGSLCFSAAVVVYVAYVAIRQVLAALGGSIVLVPSPSETVTDIVTIAVVIGAASLSGAVVGGMVCAIGTCIAIVWRTVRARWTRKRG